MNKNDKYPLVSIIITSKNAGAILPKLLESIQTQTYKNLEIILVDNFSNDNTNQVIKRFKTQLFLFGPERSAQRNYGARKASGKYLFFLDADMELTKRVVQDCVKVAKEGNYAGIVVPEQSKSIDFWGGVKAFERSFYNEKGDPITDAARFFTKEVFNKLKGYDESITGPEDWDFPDRVRDSGYKIGRVTQKIYHHEQKISLVGLFKKKFYYGLNAHKYLAKHSIPLISPKTVYFLRPLFYKNWKKLVANPILSISMIFMLFVESLGGGLGYLIGRLKS